MAQRISELVEGSNFFVSTGFSKVSITHEGLKQTIELPIKSTGVAQYQAELRDRAPKPPVKKELVAANSIDGKIIGLREDRIIKVYDTTDGDYMIALEKHNQDFIWRVIVFALDIIWKNKDGEVVDTFEEKRSILKTTGITSAHTDQIFTDVQNLTKTIDEDMDFLPGS